MASVRKGEHERGDGFNILLFCAEKAENKREEEAGQAGMQLGRMVSGADERWLAEARFGPRRRFQILIVL